MSTGDMTGCPKQMTFGLHLDPGRGEMAGAEVKAEVGLTLQGAT